MSRLNTCPFFRKCYSAHILEKESYTLFFDHYCLGKSLSDKDPVKIHQNNPCSTFKELKGEKISACIFFEQCQKAAERSSTSVNIYTKVCLGINGKEYQNFHCTQYKSFIRKTLPNFLPLLQRSTKNKK